MLNDQINRVDRVLSDIKTAIYTYVVKGSRKVKKQEIEAGEKIKLKYVSFDEFIKLTSQDNFRDAEVALKIFRTINNPSQFEDMKKLLSL